MTVLSAQTIQRLRLVHPLMEAYTDNRGNSVGLSSCGVDITLKESLDIQPYCFALASARERFSLPTHVVGVVHDKSSLARQGLAVQNTVLEPGWRGYLTLEITNHHRHSLFFPAGSAIAQVLFHFLDEPTILPYNGKYQDQEPGPQVARAAAKVE